MGQYRKLIAAVVGLGGMLANQYLEVETENLEPLVVDAIMAGLTAFGIWGVPNESKKS